ncbi:MAG TPA: hypothetical protein VFA66_13675 [Gaiellaceae bacterium]|nr:hypothetical protein [Gaiellaceae bacterium]
MDLGTRRSNHSRRSAKAKLWAVAVLAALAALMLLASAAPVSARTGDALVIGTGNFACVNFCVANDYKGYKLTGLDAGMEFPYSVFVVRQTYDGGISGHPAGFAITGESKGGTGVFGLAHGAGAGVYASNDSTGAALFAQAKLGDAVSGSTPAKDRSGVFGVATGDGWGVTGRTGSATHAGVWGDNTGANNGIYGSSHGAAASGVYGENLSGGYGVAGRANGDNPAILAENTGSGDGLEASTEAADKAGLYAHHDGSDPGNGVTAASTNGAGVHGEGSTNGVEGMTGYLYGSGVYGENTNAYGGFGVAGRSAAQNGVGVLADNTAGGVALEVNGRASFSRSSVVSFSGASFVITGIPLTGSSSVLATLQTYSGKAPTLAILSAVPNPSADSITIRMSQAAPAGTKVAYFVVN